ncbi:MAG: hypothetical protein REH79_02755 [Spiroplasma sp.]|nr:hypothetical protein [Spiroplasma sp.]
MKKLLASLTGLIAISVGSTTPILNQIQQKDNIKQQIAPLREWRFNRSIIAAVVGPNHWKYFAIDNINLSSLGINNLNDLHQYNTIEIPGLLIKFDGYLGLIGDTWQAKKRSLSSEDWSNMFTKSIDDKTIIKLETAATVWHSNSGDLMLRLAYQASIAVHVRGHLLKGGVITFDSGPLVRFY